MKYTFNKISLDDIKNEFEIFGFEILPLDVKPTKEDKLLADTILTKISKFRSSARQMSEQNLFGLVIAPLLNEIPYRTGQIQYGVKLSAKNDKVELKGVADAIVSNSLIGYEIDEPVIIIHEFKKDLEGTNPVPQLVAELIACNIKFKKYPLGVVVKGENYIFYEIRNSKICQSEALNCFDKEELAIIINILKK
jgi:hypothetical protein